MMFVSSRSKIFEWYSRLKNLLEPVEYSPIEESPTNSDSDKNVELVSDDR
jgi:hypothetical protein